MSAASWAAAVQAGTPVKWKALEVAAFQPYPAVQEQLDPGGKYGRVRHSDAMRRSFLLNLPLGILIVVLFASPVIAFAILLGSRFGNIETDPMFTIPTAGILFAGAFVFLVISLLLWLRAGRPADDIRRLQTGLALVFGVLSAVLIALHGAAKAVPDWQLWMLPALAAATLGLVFAVMLFAAARRRRAAKITPREPSATASAFVPGTIPAGEPLRRVAAQIERLSPDQQGAVRADIASAVRDLVHRGVVTPADGDWALGAELGKLALRMSQSRKRA